MKKIVIRPWEQFCQEIFACFFLFVCFLFNLKIFQGNHDRYTVATEFIDPPIIAQYVRVKPKTWDGFICMRMEFYGCTEGEKDLPIGHVRYINILTWFRGFQVKLLYLVLFSLYPKSLLGIVRQKKQEKFAILTRKPRNHARILIYRTWPIVKAGTHEAACSLSTLLEQSSLVCTNDFQRKNMLRNKTFAPEFCSLISNWFDMREQAPGANLLHEFQEQAPACVLKFASRDMTCLQLANQIGLLFQFPCPNRVISSFSSLFVSFVCTGWGTYPGVCFWSVFQEQAASCVPALTYDDILTF